MRKLRFRCHRCDEVVLSAEEVMLTSSAESYTFRCPLCRAVVVEQCSEFAARLLQFGGAGTEPSKVPTGSPTASRPVLDSEHVAELRRLLNRPDWLTLLRNSGTQ